MRSILAAFIFNLEVQRLFPYWHDRYFETSGCLYLHFMALLQPCNFCSFGKIYIISEINNITDT